MIGGVRQAIASIGSKGRLVVSARHGLIARASTLPQQDALTRQRFSLSTAPSNNNKNVNHSNSYQRTILSSIDDPEASVDYVNRPTKRTRRTTHSQKHTARGVVQKSFTKPHQGSPKLKNTVTRTSMFHEEPAYPEDSDVDPVESHFETSNLVGIVTSESYRAELLRKHLKSLVTDSEALGLQATSSTQAARPVVSPGESVDHEDVIDHGRGDGVSQLKEWRHDKTIYAKYLLDPYRSVDAFFFYEAGTIVLWGATKEEELQILKEIRLFEQGSYGVPAREQMAWTWGSRSRLSKDVVQLDANADPKTLMYHQLAFSHGLMRSVALDVLERQAEKTVEKLKIIGHDMVTKNVSQYAVTVEQALQMIGQQLLVRGKLNLHSSIQEEPDFVWERVDLEPLFRQMVTDLDVKQRTNALNRKLDYANESVQAIRTVLTEKHGHRLEMIIIILIGIEIVFFVFDRWYFSDDASDGNSSNNGAVTASDATTSTGNGKENASKDGNTQPERKTKYKVVI